MHTCTYVATYVRFGEKRWRRFTGRVLVNRSGGRAGHGRAPSLYIFPIYPHFQREEKIQSQKAETLVIGGCGCLFYLPFSLPFISLRQKPVKKIDDFQCGSGNCRPTAVSRVARDMTVIVQGTSKDRWQACSAVNTAFFRDLSSAPHKVAVQDSICKAQPTRSIQEKNKRKT